MHAIGSSQLHFYQVSVYFETLKTIVYGNFLKKIEKSMETRND